jgi:uncharacterized protein YprB with RNaseH-like and TPR domain
MEALIGLIVLITFALSLYGISRLLQKKEQERKLIAEAKARELDRQMAEERLRQFFEQHAKLERKRLEARGAVIHDTLIVLGLETQCLGLEEDGSWGAVSECLVAVAVTWDKNHEFRIWYEKDVPALLEELKNFVQILTFNGERFDFKVLEHYGSIKELKERSVDLYAFIKKYTDENVSLATLAAACFGPMGFIPPMEAVELWRTGEPEKQNRVVEYCKNDVKILRDLFVELHAVGLKFPDTDLTTTYLVHADGSHESI